MQLELELDAVPANRLMTPLPDQAAISVADLPTALKRKLKATRRLRRAPPAQGLRARRLRARVPAGTRLIAAPELGREPRTLADLAEIALGLHDL